jgi:hypothetical protein
MGCVGKFNQQRFRREEIFTGSGLEVVVGPASYCIHIFITTGLKIFVK